jgi:hypothetical protein
MEESTFPHPDKHIQKFVEDAVNQGYRVEGPTYVRIRTPTFTRDDCQRHVVLRVWKDGTSSFLWQVSRGRSSSSRRGSVQVLLEGLEVNPE